MVCVSWLLAMVMAYVCAPGFGEMCSDSSICNDLSSKDRLLAEFPELSSLALESEENEFLLGILLATLASGERIPEPNRRSEEPRTYSMEHFRWGKPIGQKRQPVKVFASSLEGGDSSEGSVPPQARRQLSGEEDEAREDLDLEGHQNQGLQEVRLIPKPATLLSPQEKRDGTYRMGHFRWGSPPAVKRYGSFMKPWEKPQGRLVKLFRNVIAKDAQ